MITLTKFTQKYSSSVTITEDAQSPLKILDIVSADHTRSQLKFALSMRMNHPSALLSCFIVGNPRSGTTMLGRILGNHPTPTNMLLTLVFHWQQVNNISDTVKRRLVSSDNNTGGCKGV